MMNGEIRKTTVTEEFRKQYKTAPELISRAPGRVDLMGSHTDYNLGFVMTMPINRDVWIAAGPGAGEKTGTSILYSMNFSEQAEYFARDPRRDGASTWVDYIAGVARQLIDSGFSAPEIRGVIHSTVPIGSGLSSSAAVECSAAVLFEALGGWSMPRTDMARLCQKAENEFVGVSCGILDQYSSLLGEKGKTVLLDCRELSHEAVPFPADLSAVICNTNAPRSLTGSEYGERRAACEEAAAFLKRIDPSVQSLRDVDPELFARGEKDMPETAAKRGRFIVEENRRVLDLADAFRQNDFTEISELMYRSFTGARDLFEITIPAMEAMEESMLGAPGTVGARQAGAGFGGCMVALVRSEQTGAFSRYVLDDYRRRTGIEAEVYAVEADQGAEVFPV